MAPTVQIVERGPFRGYARRRALRLFDPEWCGLESTQERIGRRARAEQTREFSARDVLNAMRIFT